MAALEVATSADGSSWVGHHECTTTDTLVEFGSTSNSDLYIKQTYHHLHLVASARTNRGSGYDTMQFRLNDDDTNGNYPFVQMYAYTTSAAYGNNTVQPDGMISDIAGGNSLANTFGHGEIWVPNFTKSGSYKQVLATGGRSEDSQWYMGWAANTYQSTSPVTMLTLLGNGGSFVQYSTFTLYGITG